LIGNGFVLFYDSLFVADGQVSRPKDTGEYMKRASYNMSVSFPLEGRELIGSRYFSANYAVVVALLGVYSLLTNLLLLIAMGFLIGGFLAISRFGMSSLISHNRANSSGGTNRIRRQSHYSPKLLYGFIHHWYPTFMVRCSYFYFLLVGGFEWVCDWGSCGIDGTWG
jgi:hypothetical protein